MTTTPHPEAFTTASPRQQKLFARAQKVIPGGVNSPVRAFKGVGGTPLFFAAANGAYLQDVEGKKYIDYINAWGPMVMGHCHADVVLAIQEQAQKALAFGAPTELETEAAEFLCQHWPLLEQVRFVSSGTEATMSVLRLARGFTGRRKIVKFEGCYHGHSDALLVKAGSGALTLGQTSSLGVPPEMVQHTHVLSFNDSEQLRRYFAEHGADTAAVILEVVAGNMNLVLPSPEFLQTLRQLCDQHGALVVADEVMTGFRVSLLGAHHHFGLRADLLALGKVIGGGLPVGAFGGRAEIMAHLAPLGGVYQAGTLSGSPVALAAGLATLRAVHQAGVFEQIVANTQALSDGFNAMAAKHGWAVAAHSLGTMFGLFFSGKVASNYAEATACDQHKFKQFFHAMLQRGVYLAPSAFEAGFVSAAHGAEEIQATLEAAEDALQGIMGN